MNSIAFRIFSQVDPRSEALRATMRRIVPKHRHSIVTTKFSSVHQFKNYIELFSTFLVESRESQKMKTDNSIQVQLFISYKPVCL